jgi:hypothetical protein
MMSSSSSGGGGGSAGGPCGACKFLRRKCVSGCIFAAYFDSEQGAAHEVFGASNVSKLLLRRTGAVVTTCYERGRAHLRATAAGRQPPGRAHLPASYVILSLCIYTLYMEKKSSRWLAP